MNLPSEKMRTIGKMRTELAAIAEQLYSKGKDSGIDDKSIIGLLSGSHCGRLSFVFADVSYSQEQQGRC